MNVPVCGSNWFSIPGLTTPEASAKRLWNVLPLRGRSCTSCASRSNGDKYARGPGGSALPIRPACPASRRAQEIEERNHRGAEDRPVLEATLKVGLENLTKRIEALEKKQLQK